MDEGTHAELLAGPDQPVTIDWEAGEVRFGNQVAVFIVEAFACRQPLDGDNPFGLLLARTDDVAMNYGLVDSAAMQLVPRPGSDDVILTENLFGDILSDPAAGLVGFIGLLVSASLSESGPGLFEPIHGSAPTLAGRGVVNPLGAVRSAALL